MDSIPANATLTDHADAGERLIRAASVVGDQEDFHVWRQRRNAWVSATSKLLAATGAHVEGFRVSASVAHPQSHWHAALDAEVQAVSNAVVRLRAQASAD